MLLIYYIPLEFLDSKGLPGQAHGQLPEARSLDVESRSEGAHRYTRVKSTRLAAFCGLVVREG